MFKQSITPQDVCDLLNEFINLDYDCAKGLISYHQVCNKEIADHPTIQVRKYIDDEFTKVGIVGLINGMFGIQDGCGPICYEIGDDGKIIGFKLTPIMPEVHL